jgi:hypothetical protein
LGHFFRRQPLLPIAGGFYKTSEKPLPNPSGDFIPLESCKSLLVLHSQIELEKYIPSLIEKSMPNIFFEATHAFCGLEK